MPNPFTCRYKKQPYHHHELVIKQLDRLSYGYSPAMRIGKDLHAFARSRTKTGQLTTNDAVATSR